MNAPVKWVWSDVEASVQGTETVLRHLSDGSTLFVRGGRLERGPGYASATTDVRHQLARVGAILRLRSRGRYFVHASGAVDPSGRAWLLTGDTGAGKSTLAFALSRAGWRILGDDGVVVQITTQGPIAHAWRDPLRVSLGLASRYPLLAKTGVVPAPSDERQRVPVRAEMARQAPIAGILLLAQSPVNRFARVSLATALPAIIRQSPWVLLGDLDARAHYQALNALVHTVPVFDFAHSAAQLDTVAHILRTAA